MKRNLLDLTQAVLSSLGSDEINSISDTTESLQVVEIIKTSYFNMLSRYKLPEHSQLFQLTASTDDQKPVIMYRPDGVSNINWIQYYDSNSNDSLIGDGHDINVDLEDNASSTSVPSPSYKDVCILPIKEFVDLVNHFDPNESNVEEFVFSTNSIATDEPNTFNFRFQIDKQPRFCTIIQNFYVVFDSFDGSVDSTLQTTKTRCHGLVIPSWSSVDTFTPVLDERLFPLLLNEAKSLAFLELKQMPHTKAEQEVRRQSSSFQKYKNLSNKPSDFDELPNFGRKRMF